MDRRYLVNALTLVGAVVNPFRPARSLQRSVGVSSPGSPPLLYISLIVPIGGVLPVALPAAFAVGDFLAAFVQFVDFPAFRVNAELKM